MRGHRKKAVALFVKEQKETGREVCDRLGVSSVFVPFLYSTRVSGSAYIGVTGSEVVSYCARCQGPDGNENSMEEEASLQKKEESGAATNKTEGASQKKPKLKWPIYADQICFSFFSTT
jgi:hypothetical protein